MYEGAVFLVAGAKISFFKDKISSNYSRHDYIMSLIHFTNKCYFDIDGM